MKNSKIKLYSLGDFKSSYTLSEDWCDRGSNPWTPCHKTNALPVKLTLRRLKKTVLKFPWEIIIYPCKHFLPWRTEHISMADLFLIPTIKSGNCSATNPRTVLAATLPKCCVTMSRNLEQNETIGMGEWVREMWSLISIWSGTRSSTGLRYDTDICLAPCSH